MLNIAFRAGLGFVIAAALSSPLAAQAPADSSADARLRALYTEEWSWRQKEFGRGADGFARVDAASQQARLAYWTKTLATLDTIPFDQLSAEEKVNAQIFRTSLREQVIDVRYRTYEAPFNSDTFFWTSFTPRQGFERGGVSFVSRPVARRAALLRRADYQHARRPRARLQRAARVGGGRDQPIEPYVKADAGNPLYAPFAQMPAGIPAAEQEALRAEANTVIRDVVAPAYAKLLTMIRKEYLEKARRTLGASAMPDGKKFYQAQIEKHTTLTLTPKAIHDIGLKEVARIDADMQATKDRRSSRATWPSSSPSCGPIRSSTRRRRASCCVFGLRLEAGRRQALGVLRLPAARAPRHRAGARRDRAVLDRRTRQPRRLPDEHLRPAVAPAVHPPGADAARVDAGSQLPGRARARRTGAAGVPPWQVVLRLRRRLGALHRMARHGDGHLRDAVRGLRPADVRDVARVPARHRHRHSPVRLDARTGDGYLRDRAPLAEHEITTEVDRYISWPGQALAYKLGEIQIRRHRREAEEKLGAKFDQRRFHDAILAIGSVPLPVLEQHESAQFIADELAATQAIAGGGITARLRS